MIPFPPSSSWSWNFTTAAGTLRHLEPVPFSLLCPGRNVGKLRCYFQVSFPASFPADFSVTGRNLPLPGVSSHRAQHCLLCRPRVRKLWFRPMVILPWNPSQPLVSVKLDCLLTGKSEFSQNNSACASSE